MIKNIALLGSTGSIGKNALEVVRNYPNLFKIKCLSVNSNIKDLISQIKEFIPKIVVVTNEKAYKEIKSNNLNNIKVLFGEDGLLKAVSDSEVNFVINALVGFVGLKPTVEAIKNKKNIALANKESLVVAGELIMQLAKDKKIKIIPIDSEHNALQSLLGFYKKSEIKKLILTSSGGPFRTKKLEDFDKITVEEALKHPTWAMGKKITIDSSTLLNKGFEVIEAHHLFNFEFDDIEVIIHKESLIHSMIETINGEIYAHLSPTNMKFPILNALTYPKIIQNNYERLNLTKIKTLSFEKANLLKFPLLKTAYKAGSKGGTLTCALNSANEVAVEAFLNHKIKYTDIIFIIDKVLEFHENYKNPNIEMLCKIDKETRIYTKNLVNQIVR